MKETIKKTIITLLAIMLLTHAYAQEDETMSSERGEGPVSTDQARMAMQMKHQRLVGAHVQEAASSSVYLTLNDDVFHELNVEPEQDQIGLNRLLNLDVDLRSLQGYQGKKPLDLGFGAAVPQGGAIVWTGMITAENAAAMRLHFKNVNLPEGAELYVYNDLGEAYGPFTGQGPHQRGDFWADTTFGDTVWVQLHAPAEVIDQATFTISEVAQFGDKFRLASHKVDQAKGKTCNPGGVDSCVENAECYSGSLVDNASEAVAHIVYKSDADNKWYICSGGLVNDTDNTTNIPYFLTANHCISSSSEAESVTAYFDFKTSGCGSLTSSCSSRFNNAKSVSGASLLVTGDATEGDYSLLKLSKFPSGSYWRLGWNAGDYSDNQDETIYRVSHPNGYPQAYSTSYIDTSISTCANRNRPVYIWSYPIEGGTMGGSSGSPVLNSNQQIIGQLRGGCTSDTECTSTTRVMDGSLRHAFYRNMRPYLKPTYMRVKSITVTQENISTLKRAKAVYEVVDSSGVAVSGALVQAMISGPFPSIGIGITDQEGKATLYGNPSPIGGTWTACTMLVLHGGISADWDASRDSETCDSN